MAQTELKKRKRQSQGHDVPNKKVAFDGTASSGKVKVTFTERSGLHPVLVSAPGLTTPSVPFKPYSKTVSAKSSNEGIPKPSTHGLLLHSSKHPRLDYVASPITLDEHLSHYVAVFDPSRNQLEITSAHHLSLRSTLRTEPQDDQTSQRRTIGQQREDLGREFGTKKAKKAIADKTVNALVGKDSTANTGKKDDVQSAILDSMASATAATSQQRDEAAEAAFASKPIPRPNLAAETVEDVYSLNTLIPSQDMKLLTVKDWQEKTSTQTAFPLKHRYIAKRVQEIGAREDILRLKALSYLNLLLDFHEALQGGKDRKKVPKKETLAQKCSSYPQQLIDSVRLWFSDQGNALPKWHLQNFYTHICAISLYVDGWVTHMTDLKEDLKLEQKEMNQYFKELGCKVGPPTEAEMQRFKIKKAEASVRRVAKLKLPLDFPKARAGRKK